MTRGALEPKRQSDIMSRHGGRAWYQGISHISVLFWTGGVETRPLGRCVDHLCACRWSSVPGWTSPSCSYIIQNMANHELLEQLVGSMTIAELANKAGRDVPSIVDFAFGSRKNAGVDQTRMTGTGPASVTVDTRTRAGREAYQCAVLEAIQSADGYVGAVQIRSEIGGTPMQFRAAVNRLIEAGDVTYRGKAMATRYTAA